ncbi:VWA domain-containing protein [Nitratiruptor sp. SB155-2]|uniref:VWA domain-containing protein n=1 Tax=Nitratiruptor sp. (strain SB155-2) TaxID=387092 RepID=UPI00015873F9|nr:VWA domain-containing protein [Nitratiruptor sp. SB155-2]BAF70496.1 hypothetical protein NIS_1388 [Nitratiruptor sp. SB155-2]
MLTKEDIAKLYLGLFQRAPEGKGLDEWYTQAQQNGWDYATVAEKMLDAAQNIINANPQYSSKYPHYIDVDANDFLSTKSVITEVYKSLFNKDYIDDPNGIDSWANYAVQNGLGNTIANITQVATQIANGAIPASAQTVAHAKAFLNKVQVALEAAQKIPEADINGDGLFDFDDFKALIDGIDDRPESIDQAKQKILEKEDLYNQSHNQGGTKKIVQAPADGGDVSATDLDEIIYGSDNNDIIRPGKGQDEVYAGKGDDDIVLLGDLTGLSAKDRPEDAQLIGKPLKDILGRDFAEDANGAEIIDGGEGSDTLHVYGNADLSDYDIKNIENIDFLGDLTLPADLINKLQKINGNGMGSFHLADNGNKIPVDLSATDIEGINQLHLDNGVEAQISSLDDLGDAHILTGDGKVVGKPGTNFSLDDTYTVEPTLQVLKDGGIQDAKGDAVTMDNVVADQAGMIVGTDGDDYLIGSDGDDTLYSKAGDDILVGKNGSDTYVIDGVGKKVIIDGSQNDSGVGDTLDLSMAPTSSGADIDLASGGNVGQDIQVQLGANDTKGALIVPQFNIMLILDVSGSMGWDSGDGTTRLSKEVEAAQKLLQEYSKLGDVAVKLVLFSSDVSNQAQYIPQNWMSVDKAIGMLDNLYADGTTDYVNAIDGAMQLFDQKDGTFFDNGANRVYFMSDGEPSYGGEIDGTLQHQWENFLIQHDIIANAIGFGDIQELYNLEPIAFDGTRLDDINADHNIGQIAPALQPDINKLEQSLLNQAKIDFIENVIGTPNDDILHGNTLDNTINGNDGDDILYGGYGKDILIGGNGVDTVMISPEQTLNVDQFMDPQKGEKIKWKVANGTEQFVSTPVQWQGSLEATMNVAAQGNGSQNSIVSWFTDGKSAFVVVDNSPASSFDPLSDEVVQLVGITDLSTAQLDEQNDLLVI